MQHLDAQSRKVGVTWTAVRAVPEGLLSAVGRGGEPRRS